METQHLTPALERLRLYESPLLTSPDQNPNPNPNPNPNQNPNSNPHLRPSKSTAFKREERRKRKERKRQQRLQTLFDHPPPSVSPNPTVSDLPWPCDPAPSLPPTPTAWPPTSIATASAAPPPPPSAAAHAAALRASRAFFASEAESNGEDDDTEEEGDEIGGRARGFFKDLFARDGDLREYYEREWARGEFRCLVCEGVGARAGKRFWGCAALVQHAAAVARTRARRAHRAFGTIVRRVLGWEDLQVESCEDVASNEDGLATNAMDT